MKKRYFITLLWALVAVACKKSDFLDKKPVTNLQVPTTLSDFQSLLDNTTIFNQTGGLATVSADEYTVNYTDLQTASATERNASIWAIDIYQGDVNIADWNMPYQQVFYANSVLDELAKSDSVSSSQGQYLKAWALFNRAFAFYDLTRTFCKAYNSSTASGDLGIPLRLSSNIDYTVQRSTLQQSYDQILSDINLSLEFLPSERPSANLNRPSKIAAYALLARIHLDMRDYTSALDNADKALSLYSTLIDYNTVSKTSTTPFSATNVELLFSARQATAFGVITPNSFVSIALISTDLLSTYDTNDLRLSLYFAKRTDGTSYRKRGYFGSGGYAFTGLATDELYLIKAECQARAGQVNEAMTTLNILMSKRFTTGTFTNLSAADAQAALGIVLQERKKELVWRGLRWFDLKRLNADGGQISLSRTINGTTYTLPANDNKWIFPIPSDEISRSGIAQNPR